MGKARVDTRVTVEKQVLRVSCDASGCTEVVDVVETAVGPVLTPLDTWVRVGRLSANPLDGDDEATLHFCPAHAAAAVKAARG